MQGAILQIPEGKMRREVMRVMDRREDDKNDE